jgi:hypothetical protein
VVTAAGAVEDHGGETGGLGLDAEGGAESGRAGDVGLQLLATEVLGGGREGDEGHALVVVDGLGVEMRMGHLEREARAGGGAAHRLADAPATLLRQEILLLQFHGMCSVRAD